MVVKKLLEQFDEDVIRAFVQKNADYYLLKWKLMAENNSKTSWNWASFFFVGFWMGYRKMYLYYTIYYILSFLAGIFGSILLLMSMAFIGKSLNLSEDILAAIFILFILLLVIANFVIFGIFGNYIYAMYVYNKLNKFSLLAKDKENLKLLALSKGGTSWLGIFVVILIGFLLNLFIELTFFLVALIIKSVIPTQNNIWQ